MSVGNSVIVETSTDAVMVEVSQEIVETNVSVSVCMPPLTVIVDAPTAGVTVTVTVGVTNELNVDSDVVAEHIIVVERVNVMVIGVSMLIRDSEQEGTEETIVGPAIVIVLATQPVLEPSGPGVVLLWAQSDHEEVSRFWRGLAVAMTLLGISKSSEA
jgi:hypothetical protein